MDIAEAAQEGDITLSRKGLRVFLEKNADKWLAGAIMDYSDTHGFVVSGMPKSSCCG